MPSRSGLGALVALSAQLLLSTACATDGAVRLSYCIERAAERLASSNQGEARERCDLGISGPSKVVVFPAEWISSARLEQEGLTQEDLWNINELTIFDYPYSRINVLPAARRPRASRTTYHRRFVEVPELLVCHSERSEVAVVVRRSGDSLILAAIEEGGS